MRKIKKVKKRSLSEKLKYLHKMTPEELENYYNITRKSARVYEDKSKFNKKKSRQEKITY